MSESRLKAQSQVEQLTDLHSQRLALYDQFLDAANKMKASKDAGAASTTRKRVENDLKMVTQNIQDAQVTLKGAGLDLVEKVCTDTYITGWIKSSYENWIDYKLKFSYKLFIHSVEYLSAFTTGAGCERLSSPLCDLTINCSIF